jgi:hypothetical protein
MMLLITGIIVLGIGMKAKFAWNMWQLIYCSSLIGT